MANQEHPNTNEEVDLGQIFNAIGTLFKSVKNAVIQLFQGLGNLLLWLLLFLQKNVLFFILSVLIGAIAGYFIEDREPTQYISKMVVEPNFNSVQQLYNNVVFYNDLAKSEDSITLGSTLGVSPEIAASIVKVTVDSYSDENQKIQLFDRFIKELDTTTVKAIDYNEFLKNFNSLDARFHQITIIATNSDVAKMVQPQILSAIEKNDYFKRQKAIFETNIELQASINKQQLKEIDSLQELYKKVMLEQASNPLQGTNISLGEATNDRSGVKELALLDQRELIKQRLVRLNQESTDKETIVNVISDFPVKGVKDKRWSSNFILLLPVLMTGITTIILLLIQLNKFLKKKKAALTSP